MEFIQYRRSQIAELRMYEPEEDMTMISVSVPDAEAGSPRLGDMIARNPKNHADQWLVAAQYFRDNFEPLHGEKTVDQSALVTHAHKETSSRVSTIASDVLRTQPLTANHGNLVPLFNKLLEHAKTLAGSCMSQDETPGKEPLDFLGRLHVERNDLAEKLGKLTTFLAGDSFRRLPAIQRELLEAQRIHMSEYLAVLDARLADLGISERSGADTSFDPKGEKTLQEIADENAVKIGGTDNAE